ncbi:D-amino acid dehydrogenase [Caldimonas sp. KR1-144]|uniref:D-amino acid dehydrogenase n=1 Tax=Caldimonas sp. KR1-144 TaxID=3400911 RepID=UPI003C1202DE
MNGRVPPAQARRVCVVGAGIVGCATAYALAREGWDVTLVDALAAPGQGTSLANGAQLSYSYVEPLATPAALRALPGWLLSSDGPLRWRPRPDLAHLRWLMAFVLACRTSQVRRTTAALLALSSLSRATLHRWLDELPHVARAAGHARPGKLVIYRKPELRPGVERQLAWQRELGCRQSLVDEAECLRLEPALAAARRERIAFGVWTEDEEVIDTAVLARALAGASRARLLLNHRVTGLVREGGRIRGLTLDGACREIAADHVVLAAGSAMTALLAPLRLALPIEPIKGYSVTLPIVNASAAPRASITDQSRKMVFARLGEKLRVAGFAELVGQDLRVDGQRIEALCEAARALFPEACDTAQPQPWAGLRPATPSGRPLVGALGFDNLWVHAGHGALGLTLAPGSAALLAQLMAGAPAAVDAELFRP